MLALRLDGNGMTARGAWATVRFLDETDTLSPVYISFGEYDEDKNQDTFGVHDERIFFYCENEAELIDLMKEGKGADFIVLGYTLEEVTA